MAIAVPTTTSDYTTASSASTNTLTGNKPVNTATGDYLIAWVAFRNASGTITAPSGWTQFGSTDVTNQTAQAFYHLVSSAGSEPSSYAFSVSGASRGIIIIFRVTGANQSSILDVAGAMSAHTGTASVSIPGITTTVNNDELVAFLVGHNSSTSGPVFSAPSGFTLLTSQTVNNGASSISTAVAVKAGGTAGATGTLTAAMSPAATSSDGFVLSIKPPSGPVASFTAQAIGTDGVFTNTSTAASPATLSSYAWTFGDSTTSTAASPTHKYASAGTYTVGLTVTDSNGTTATTSQSLVVTAPGGTATVSSVSVGTGWVAVGAADLTTALSDTTGGAPNLGTFIVSPVGPSSQPLRYKLGPLAPAAAGQPLALTLWIDRISSTSGSLTATLYEGATARSVLTGLTIADMAASGGSGDATSGAVSATATTLCTFPAVDVAAVTDWNQLEIALSVTAA